MNKKTLTKKRIVKDYLKYRKQGSGAIVFMIVFALVAFFIVPAPVGWIIGLIVLGIAAFTFMKFRSWLNVGDPRKTYIRLLPVLQKQASSYGDEDSGGVNYYLLFTEEEPVKVSFRVYHKAEEGTKFFVVFFEKDNIPILCYNADEWEADGNLSIR